MDPTSLERLHDIVVPPPTPWWPPAPGWLWLLALLSVVAATLALRWFVRRQRNRYRREALAELARLDADVRDPSKRAGALAAMSVLLKRTALTAYGREPVASLTGPAWFDFLDRSGDTRFRDGLGAALEAELYDLTNTVTGTGVTGTEFVAEIRRWIRGHGPAPLAAGAARDTLGATVGKAA